MKDLKPKLILTKPSGQQKSSITKSFLIFVVAFALGLLVGININSVNLSSKNGPEVIKGNDTETTNKQVGLGKGEETFSISEGTKISEEDLSTEASEDDLIAVMPEDDLGSDNDLKQLEISERQEDDIDEIFALQVGAFKKYGRARKSINELEDRGYEPYIIPFYNSLGEYWYLIKIGKFKTMEEAKNFANHFQEKEGMEAFVEKLK